MRNKSWLVGLRFHNTESENASADHGLPLPRYETEKRGLLRDTARLNTHLLGSRRCAEAGRLLVRGTLTTQRMCCLLFGVWNEEYGRGCGRHSMCCSEAPEGGRRSSQLPLGHCIALESAPTIVVLTNSFKFNKTMNHALQLPKRSLVSFCNSQTWLFVSC